MTDMYRERDTAATVAHARSILRKLEGTKVNELDQVTIEVGKAHARDLLRDDAASVPLRYGPRKIWLRRKNRS